MTSRNIFLTAAQLFVVMILSPSTTLAQTELMAANQRFESSLKDYSAVLQRKAKQLQTVSSPVCEDPYKEIFSQSTTHLSVVYGYLDFDRRVQDWPLAISLVNQLQRRCEGNLRSCGFKYLHTKPGYVGLWKSIWINDQFKKVYVHVFFPSVETLVIEKTDPLYAAQMNQSSQTEKYFLDALEQSQVVYYNGHSRMGKGPDFAPMGVTDFADRSPRWRFNRVLKVLSDSKKSIKLFGLFSCESKRHYEKDLIIRAPGLGLLTTTPIITVSQTQQGTLGALELVLARKCKDDADQTLWNEEYPNRKGKVKLSNFFN